jgi:hypothetical protein
VQRCAQLSVGDANALVDVYFVMQKRSYVLCLDLFRSYDSFYSIIHFVASTYRLLSVLNLTSVDDVGDESLKVLFTVTVALSELVTTSINLTDDGIAPLLRRAAAATKRRSTSSAPVTDVITMNRQQNALGDTTSSSSDTDASDVPLLPPPPLKVLALSGTAVSKKTLNALNRAYVTCVVTGADKPPRLNKPSMSTSSAPAPVTQVAETEKKLN